MKRTLILFLVLIISVSTFASCKKQTEPELSQIKSIAQLVTLTCEFNNVGKSTLDKGKGITHTFEKNREYWVEYRGYVKIGINAELLDMKVSGNVVTVTMPHAKIMDDGILDGTEMTEYYSKDSFLNKNTIPADSQTDAVATGNEKMRESVESDKTLLLMAENRAKALIENYIKSIQPLTGKEYTVKWKMIDNPKEN